MSDRLQRFPISDLSGGRNGVDGPTSPRFADNQVADAVNVDWYQTSFARKRNGSSAAEVTFAAGGPFTDYLATLIRHVPGTNPTAAEVWAIDGALVVGRKAAAATFTAPTFKDALTGNGWDVSAASLNGKLFLAYQSAQDRLHCWDGSTVRRTGLPQPAAPTAANTAAGGAYAATLRYYRVRWTQQSGGVTVRRSEPSTSVSITPDGAHTGITVTQPTVPDEGETHWELEVSLDNSVWYVHYGDVTGATGAAVAIATTTKDDTTVTTTYATLGTPAAAGTYTVQKSYKFIAADQNRLLGFGSYTSTDKQNRVEISAVVGALNIGDAERVDTTLNYYEDLDEHDSGVAMGLHGPIFGNFYAFKDRQTWELVPTGTTRRPYRSSALSKEIGLVASRAVARGEDATGNAALYWLSHRGFYRYGIRGMEYIGAGVEDLILGPTSTINLAATNVVAHAVYHADKWQFWCWFAVGSDTDPSVLAVYDVKTGGWARYTGISAARCSAMLPSTIGTTMSRTLVPYIGRTSSVNTITKLDDASVTQDSGAKFQAYVDLKDFEPGGPGFNGHVGDAVLLAKAASSVQITATVIPDFDETRAQTGTAQLTAEGSETRVIRRLEGSGLSGVSFVRYRIGDEAAASNAWTIDRLTVPYRSEEAQSA